MRLAVDILQILGGSDVAEPFNIPKSTSAILPTVFRSQGKSAEVDKLLAEVLKLAGRAHPQDTGPGSDPPEGRDTLEARRLLDATLLAFVSQNRPKAYRSTAPKCADRLSFLNSKKPLCAS